MQSVRERPGLFRFYCPYCNNEMVIAAVFHEYGHRYQKTKNRYEAWARFWFEKGGRGGVRCKVIYEDKQFAPSRAATEVTGHAENGWTFWRFVHEKGSIKLNELASML